MSYKPEPILSVIINILTISFITVNITVLGAILLSFYWDNILKSIFTGGIPTFYIMSIILLFLKKIRDSTLT